VLRSAADESDLPSVGKRLVDAIEIAKSGLAAGAYSALHGSQRGEGWLNVQHIGPAYGTKVLHFGPFTMSNATPEPIILDSNVARALGWLCNAKWRLDGWTTQQYSDYLDIAFDWSRSWSATADVVELVLFSVGQSKELPYKH